MGAKKKSRSTKARRAQPTKEPATRVRAGAAAQKNLRKDHDKATYELESTDAAARPSRKSTRRGANRVKPDSQLKRRHTRAIRSPQSRHAMRGA